MIAANEYLSTLRARAHALRTRLAAAVELRRRYERDISEVTATHGSRPTGIFAGIMPTSVHFGTVDVRYAQLMSEPYEQLRIAINRAIEIVNRQDVSGGPPADGAAVLAATTELIPRAREQFEWYLNSPASRHDPRRGYFERFSRLLIAGHPWLAPALRSAGYSEGEAARVAAQTAGFGVAQMPEQAELRYGGASEEYLRQQTTATEGDPSGHLAQVGRDLSAAGKATVEAAQAMQAGTAAATRAGAEFARRGAFTYGAFTGAGRRGEGLRWSDVALIGGVGLVTVGGLYLYLKTRPSLIAAGTALKALKRNPDGTVEYVYEDEDEPCR